MSQINPNVVYLPEDKLTRAAEQFETPFFVYDEKRIRDNCRALKDAMGRYFENAAPLYAVKANTNPEVLRIIFSEGFGADASSEAEAWVTHKLGAWGMYTGNYTTEPEMRYVLEKGLMLNLDDISLLPVLDGLGMPEFLSFRINPGISKGGMKSLFFAGPDAKYGVPWEEAPRAYAEAKRLGVKRFGIHMMTGSNVLEEAYFEQVTAKLLEIAGSVKKEVGIDFDYLNVGGGFGVPYRPEERGLDLDKLFAGIRRAFDQQCSKHNLVEPRLMIEPGRYVMADAGWLVTRVHVIKDGYKRFAGVDAGMNDLPRPAIYDAYHHVTVLGKSEAPATEPVSIVGRLCENNDQFAKDRMLPRVEIGDVVAIHNAGAHSYAMGHNYNNRLRSAEYLLGQDGRFKQIRRAETIDDLFATTTLSTD